MGSIMNDKEWIAEEKRWRKGIDPITASVEDITSFFIYKISEYEICKTIDTELWCTFTQDFEDFTLDNLNSINVATTKKMYMLLRQSGVYIEPKNKRPSYAQLLFNVIQEEQEHKWTQEELEEVQEQFFEEGLRSNRLKYRIYKNSTRLVQGLVEPVQPAQPAQTQPVQPAQPAQSTQQQHQQHAASDSQYAASIQDHDAYTPRHAKGWGKEIASSAKMFKDELKYDGTNGSLDYKLAIFYNVCSRCDIPPEAYGKALPNMLSGLALNQYFTRNLANRSFEEACEHLRNFFEGPGSERKNLSEWNAISLATVIEDSKDKPLSECLQLLVNKLSLLQHGLPRELRTDSFLTNKLVTACQEIKACQYATADPPQELGPLINKLQSSIIAWEKQNPEQTRIYEQSRSREQSQSRAYYTDRRYHGQKSYTRGDSRFRKPMRRDKPRCFVCGKENCRSYKHPKDEQDESKEKFRRANKDKFAKFNDRDRLDSRIKQYIADYEGTDSDSEDELEELFEALTVDTSSTKTGNTSDDVDHYFASFGQVKQSEASLMITELANQAFCHSLTAQDIMTTPVSPTDSQDSSPFSYTSTISRYSADNFLGIMIDTGASRRSTAGYSQYQALLKLDHTIKLDCTTKGTVNVQFGIGSTSSIGSIKTVTPIGIIEFHVVKVDTPFLLCLADMDNLQVYFNNLRNVLITPQGEVHVARRFGHPFLLWDTPLYTYLTSSFTQNPCFLTDVELKRLHRRFGHPSVERLARVLERSGHEVEGKTLEHLTRYCHYCQKHGKSPGRFRFTLREDVDFNYCIIVDIMYIDGAPVLHIVDEGTRFQAGRWLSNISAKHTWDTLRACWIDTYLGPPDMITHDAGKNFISKEFKQYAMTLGTTTKGVPVEAHNSIGMVERYHGPLRRAYRIISVELPDLGKDMALQMAFKAINDSAGPGGLVPTLLVFGAYPRLVESDAPNPSVAQRTVALKKAMDEIKKLRAERQIADALNMRNGPITTAIHDLPLNSQVLVWREGPTGQAGYWSGPYCLLSIDNETCTVQLPHGPTSFRSTSVKPYLVDPDPDADVSKEGELQEFIEHPKEFNEHPKEFIEHPEEPQSNRDETAPRPAEPFYPRPLSQMKRGRGRPRKYPIDAYIADITVYLQEDNDNQFTASRHKEIMGLLEKGVFELVKQEDIPQGIRIFNSRFVDELRNQGTDKAFEKSRLVVQAYNDEEKSLVLTQSPTIQRVSQRLILYLAAITIDGTADGSQLYLRDISQAYVQSSTKLVRDFYIRAPAELSTALGVTKGTVVKIVRPLYGIPEAGNHWFKTYHTHHAKKLSMDQSTYDPCLLHVNDSTSFGVIGLQTDDTLILANSPFADSEQKMIEEAKFLTKERERLTPEHPLKFNGGIIQQHHDVITLTQEKQCKNLTLVNIKNRISTTSSKGVVRSALTPKDQYVAQRARGAYIASTCQPEASFDLSYAAQVINPNEKDAELLNKRIQWQIDNPARGLKFVKLDVNTLQLIVFTDSSFANNKDLSSQIGYVIALTDSTNRANIVHWSSTKCKRVTRSVLASELYAMVHGFDIGAAIKATIELQLGIKLPLILCTDSKSIYDCLVKLGTTQEKRLMIDIMCLRQSYERREIAEVKWIDGDSNPADSMTKGKPSQALKRLLDTNHIELQEVQWVERVGSGGQDDKQNA